MTLQRPAAGPCPQQQLRKKIGLILQTAPARSSTGRCPDQIRAEQEHRGRISPTYQEATVRTDLPATCSAALLHGSSLQKRGLSPFLSCTFIQCHLPGAPGTFSRHGPPQCHRYGYCPALLCPEASGPQSPGALGTSPRSQQASASALQSSQPIASSLAPGRAQPRSLTAHTSAQSWWPQPVPNTANKDIMFLKWSCYGVSLTLPPGDVSAGSQTDLCRDDVVAVLFAQFLVWR